ncbi:MAG: hypothetical protein JWL73_3928 [Actinomycetia bacterium]|nr:hypothetical protein [Actinomycetes bacterium]
MLAEFDGKVAVVTGAGSGIGAALVHACTGRGMFVVAADVDLQSAQGVVHELGPDRAIAVAVDVSDPDRVEHLAEVTVATFGAVDLLFNNAGVSPTGLLWEYTPADWDWVVGVNLTGVVNGVRAFVPRMIAQGNGGHVVNTASIAALRVMGRHSAYSATKHAVLALSDGLRLDLAPFGIGVSALCPTAVNTNIFSRMVRPSAGADPAVVDAEIGAFLAGMDIDPDTMVEPDRVAELALWGVAADVPYIMTAPSMKEPVAARYRAIVDAHDSAKAHDPTLP